MKPTMSIEKRSSQSEQTHTDASLGGWCRWSIRGIPFGVWRLAHPPGWFRFKNQFLHTFLSPRSQGFIYFRT
jgi:hypothetical protein